MSTILLTDSRYRTEVELVANRIVHARPHPIHGETVVTMVSGNTHFVSETPSQIASRPGARLILATVSMESPTTIAINPDLRESVSVHDSGGELNLPFTKIVMQIDPKNPIAMSESPAELRSRILALDRPPKATNSSFGVV